MNIKQFERLKNDNYNYIPLTHEVMADMDTPLSVYLKLADGPYSYIFESIQNSAKSARYSIIGLPCKKHIKVYGQTIIIEENGKVLETHQSHDPLKWIEEYHNKFKATELEGLPSFTGGLVGYFGYETIEYIEPKIRKQTRKDALNTPDILLMISEEIIVFNNISGKIHFIVNIDPHDINAYRNGARRLDELEEKLHSKANNYNKSNTSNKINEHDFVSGFTKDEYISAVDNVKNYITKGDAMQVVLSQRLSIPFQAPPIDLYRSLRSLNPSPYMFYLNIDDHHVVGSSPEILVRLENNEVTVRPIAGTRARGKDSLEDNALEQDLLSDPKELAEHLMLIDLGRNDIGRVSNIGSVKLTEKMTVELYSHVMHIVSNVVGKLKTGKNAFDVLRATFPAGTVSGAPKIRAMEIINELEPIKRGIYSGAVGYISWNGNMDTAIAIRTAVIKDNTLNIQAGAGIVHDSNPESEWAETMNKARAIFTAAAIAEAGIDTNKHQESSAHFNKIKISEIQTENISNYPVNIDQQTELTVADTSSIYI